jgi:hypothetical protein
MRERSVHIARALVIQFAMYVLANNELGMAKILGIENTMS